MQYTVVHSDKAASQGMEITILNYLMNKSGLNVCLPVRSHNHLIAIFWLPNIYSKYDLMTKQGQMIN